MFDYSKSILAIFWYLVWLFRGPQNYIFWLFKSVFWQFLCEKNGRKSRDPASRLVTILFAAGKTVGSCETSREVFCFPLFHKVRLTFLRWTRCLFGLKCYWHHFWPINILALFESYLKRKLNGTKFITIGQPILIL